MRILVIGSGAIGTLLGVMLKSSGNEVVFYDHPDRLDSLQNESLSVIFAGAKKKIKSLDLLKSLEVCKEPFDLAILCIKAYHTDDFIKSCPDGLFDRLLTIQNGLGNEEKLIDRFGIDKILSGAITLPVAKKDSYTVEITNNKGGIAFSGVNGKSCSDIVKLFSLCGFQTVQCRNYQEMKWSKLLLNILGNALSAITSMTVQEIFDNRQMTLIEKKAIMEAISVMKKMGLKPVNLPGYPVKLMVLMFSLATPTIIEIIMSLTQSNMSRGDKMPSLYIDLESKSKNSEVDVLNGAVYHKGIELGFDMKANGFLFKILSGIVSGEIRRDEYSNSPDKLFIQFVAGI